MSWQTAVVGHYTESLLFWRATNFYLKNWNLFLRILKSPISWKNKCPRFTVTWQRFVHDVGAPDKPATHTFAAVSHPHCDCRWCFSSGGRCGKGQWASRVATGASSAPPSPPPKCGCWEASRVLRHCGKGEKTQFDIISCLVMSPSLL